ncbi:hypothetical protein SLS62_008180 [Diatrype stigma]|uniref:Uncharacterized protein n=1 Tax=Diatrype stigma TaxID=117547 RepID=A0AAN9YP61_9PEZI
MALDRRHVDLPASMFVMMAVFFFMSAANRIHGGVAPFYSAHLQGPTDFIGRHMSLGFVAPFVMLNRDHISEPLDAPKIAAVFASNSSNDAGAQPNGSTNSSVSIMNHGPAPGKAGTRSTLVILANPVLLTAGFGTIYFWIKTLLTRTTIDQVIEDFRRNSTLAEALTHITEDQGLRRYVGTGDLACVILDAGIFCLGMKMFENRRELAASFFAVVSTCLFMATISVFLNVTLARAMGLEAEEALAFAAKSVTIALGVPAIQKINGSTTLMSALCICSGMSFQMFGNFMLNFFRIDDRMLPARLGPGNSSIDTEKAAPSDYCPQYQNNKSLREESKLLAAGVTIGINAAALGTAHLIERDSTAVAYSALSMSIFGGLIVALTALPGVSDLLMRLATR